MFSLFLLLLIVVSIAASVTIEVKFYRNGGFGVILPRDMTVNATSVTLFGIKTDKDKGDPRPIPGQMVFPCHNGHPFEVKDNVTSFRRGEHLNFTISVSYADGKVSHGIGGLTEADSEYIVHKWILIMAT